MSFPSLQNEGGARSEEIESHFYDWVLSHVLKMGTILLEAGFFGFSPSISAIRNFRLG